MRVIVLVKEVPDTYGDRKLDLESGLADRAATDRVLDEIGERALEAALAYADESSDVEVVALSMGPESTSESLRKALAMGAASAIHVLDDDLLGADLTITSEVLAAAVLKAGFDLVVTGNLSTDGGGGVLPAMLAERLGVPHATSLTEFEVSGDEVRGRRAFEGGTMQLRAALPAVISITEAMPDARFPSFKGVMAAKRKPLETWKLKDLGVELAESAIARSIVIAVSERPPRAAGKKLVDDGDAGRQLAEYLVAQQLA